MILNKQKKVRLATRPLREFLRKAQRELNIAHSEITVAFVSNEEITCWNEAYRNQKGPTDVLSFPATSGVIHALSRKKAGATYPATGGLSDRSAALQGGRRRSRAAASTNAGSYKPPARDGSKMPEILCDIPVQRAAAPPEILGDIAIAPETARRYAKKNGRSLQSEIRVLMLHGILHLMGYDHESDTGQMKRIERKLRRRLGIA